MNALRFDVVARDALALTPSRLVIAGWTGRDRAAIEAHIDELAALGVPRPSAVPLYYRVSCAALTQDDTIEVLGDRSSGEAEPVLVRAEGRWWLTVGSDHTDRSVETRSVAQAKQMCAKPLARTAWAWDDVTQRADELLLRSQIFECGRWVTYQEGRFDRLLPLAEVLERMPADLAVADGLVMYCGTLGVVSNAAGIGIRPAERMRIEIIDAARRIVHEYRAVPLPVVA